MARIVTVGINGIQVAQDNPARVGWQVIMPATSIEAGNTGRVHVGKGFIPSTVVGAPDQGLILTANSQVGEEKLYESDRSVFLGSIWLLASIASQRVWVEEAISQEAPAPAG